MKQSKLTNCCIKGLKLYNKEKHINSMLQEMAELQVELTNIQRNRTTRLKIVKELADVRIMVEQLKLIFSNDDEFDRIVKEKLNKYRKRMWKLKRKNGTV